MSRPDLQQYFDEATAFASSPKGDSTVVQRDDLFLPTNKALQERFDKITRKIRLKIEARTGDERDAWMRLVMSKYLPAEVCAAPAAEFAAALRAAGVYGKEFEAPGDGPGVRRFVLYGRTEEEPHEIIAVMKFEATLNGGGQE